MLKISSARQSPSRLRSWIAKLYRDRSGSLIVTFAVATPVVLGAVGLGVESGLWYTAKRSLQTEADAAALSGAYERAKGRPTNVMAAAMREAVRNGFVAAAPNTSTVNNPPASGPNAGEPEAVEVLLGKQQQPLFSGLFLGDLTISVRSVAMVQTTGTACVLALDPSMDGALTSTGNPTVNMAGCVMAANSTSASAINMTGSTTVTAQSLWTAGGYTNGGSATINLTTPAETNAWALDDPYASMTVPNLSGCDHNNFSSNSTQTLNPGVFCNGFSLQSHANIALNPGTYYIDGGNLQIQGGAKVRCNCPGPNDGVTFVMTSSTSASQIGTADIRGGADVVLSAPKTGSFAGLIFFQDPRATNTAGDNKFNGGASMQLTGAIYSRYQTVEYTGNNDSGGANCTQIIGRHVVFTGHSTINNTGCPTAGVEPLKIVGVRVVE